MKGCLCDSHILKTIIWIWVKSVASQCSRFKIPLFVTCHMIDERDTQLKHNCGIETVDDLSQIMLTVHV